MHSIFAFLFLMLCRFVTQNDKGRCKVNPWSANLEANGYTVTDSPTNRKNKEYFQHKKRRKGLLEKSKLSERAVCNDSDNDSSTHFLFAPQAKQTTSPCLANEAAFSIFEKRRECQLQLDF